MNGSDNLNGYTEPDVVEKVPAEETVVETNGLFSGSQSQNVYDTQNPYGTQGGYGAQNPYGNQSAYSAQNPYGTQSGYGAQNPNGAQGGYGAQNPYGAQGGYGAQNPYGAQGGYGAQNPYGAQGGYGAQNPYGTQDSYGAQNPYGTQDSYGAQNPYGNQSAYSMQNPNHTQNPYGNQVGGGSGGQPPIGGGPPYGNPYNPYSPFAAPQKKQHVGLIVGIVVVIVILFVIAVIALASRAVSLLSDKEKDKIRRDIYEMDDYDYDYDHHDYDHDEYEYDYDYDYDYPYYDYDDDYGYSFGDETEGYDFNSEQYYTLHDEIRDDLSYSVEFEMYEYETDNDNVYIAASLPTISGEDVPNLKTLNESIQQEVETVTELFEKDYESRIKGDEDSFFQAALSCYATYMDEDKLSIVYDERIYCNIGDSFEEEVSLVCLNVDMKNGVVLDNKEMLVTDDAFSVEFRKKSDEQNGEISYLTSKTDQQITKYFNSENIIVFYTPKGMEIGFNYEEGWVTVTYEEYEKYLKVF